MTTPTAARPARYNRHTPQVPAWRSHPASPAQRARLATLYAEYNPLVAADMASRGPVDGYSTAEFDAMIATIRDTPSTPEDFDRYTKGQASDLITSTIEAIRTLKARAPRPAPAPAAPAITEPGMYITDGPLPEIYRVKRSRQSGNLYAQRLLVTLPQPGDEDQEPTSEWIYEGAAPLKATARRPLQQLTREQAAQYGQDTGICCCCGALLTDPTSVANGIGPICAGRL